MSGNNGVDPAVPATLEVVEAAVAYVAEVRSYFASDGDGPEATTLHDARVAFERLAAAVDNLLPAFKGGGHDDVA